MPSSIVQLRSGLEGKSEILSENALTKRISDPAFRLSHRLLFHKELTPKDKRSQMSKSSRSIRTRILAFAVPMAAVFVAAPSAQGGPLVASAGSCDAQELSQPFMPWRSAAG